MCQFPEFLEGIIWGLCAPIPLCCSAHISILKRTKACMCMKQIVLVESWEQGVSLDFYCILWKSPAT